MKLLTIKRLIVASFLLGSSAAGFAYKTFQQAAELANLGLELAKTQAMLTASRKALSNEKAHSKKALAKQKAKGRLKRIVVAAPIAGIAAAAAFEVHAYNEWKNENPCGTVEQYGTEVTVDTSEVIDEVLQELPEYYRPSPVMMSGLVLEAIEFLPDTRTMEASADCQAGQG